MNDKLGNAENGEANLLFNNIIPYTGKGIKLAVGNSAFEA